MNNLKKQSGSHGIVIVGGTEVTEARHGGGLHSHKNGFKVDLEKNNEPVLTNFIKNFTRIADRSDGSPQWQDESGNIYCVSTFSFSQCLHLFSFSLMDTGADNCFSATGPDVVGYFQFRTSENTGVSPISEE